LLAFGIVTFGLIIFGIATFGITTFGIAAVGLAHPPQIIPVPDDIFEAVRVYTASARQPIDVMSDGCNSDCT